MYSQGKQIIYITTRGKDQRQFNGCDCLMSSKHCDGVDTHKRVRAACSQEQRDIAQETQTPELDTCQNKSHQGDSGSF